MDQSAGLPSPGESGVLTYQVGFQTLALLVLRALFYFFSRHYVNSSLFSDLKSVITDTSTTVASEPADQDGIALDELEKGGGGYIAGASGSALGVQAGLGLGGTSRGRKLSLDGAELPKLRREGSDTPQAKAILVKRRNHLYPTLSTFVFCLSFSESCMLFSLVLFGDVLGEEARSLNWAISLFTILSLIIFVIPLGLCLLLSHRTPTTPAPRTVILTLVPFGAYLFLFYNYGSLIASQVVTERPNNLDPRLLSDPATENETGLINGLLSRICVPGVFLIGGLSGGGAVNTAWDSFEWRALSALEPISDEQIRLAEEALARNRQSIRKSHATIALTKQSVAREAASTTGLSLFARLTSSGQAAGHLKSHQAELSGLQALDEQMVRDLEVLRKRKMMKDLKRSIRGRLWLAAGWTLSIYCVCRVGIACVNLIFGYSQRHHHANRPGSEVDTAPLQAGSDILTSLLKNLADTLKIDIDVATWARMIGLLLIGGIIVANMRRVLGSVSRIFKATSMGVSASFMLLFLAELMSIYLITSLISLPQSATESTTTLLDTLPSFDVFSRLFDTIFLISAGAIFILRYVERKIRVSD